MPIIPLSVDPPPSTPTPVPVVATGPLRRLLTQSVTVVNRAPEGTDTYGNEAMEETDRYDVLAYVEQTESTEVQVDRDTVISDALLVLATHRLQDDESVPNEIGSGDVVITTDGTYEVIGDPARVWSPRLRGEHHVEARLRATSDVPAEVS